MHKTLLGFFAAVAIGASMMQPARAITPVDAAGVHIGTVEHARNVCREMWDGVRWRTRCRWQRSWRRPWWRR